MSLGQLQLTLEPERRVFAVHELNAAIQNLFESEFRSIFVSGEISGCRQASSGHYYFALKDEQSQIKCVLFRGAARFARFKPQEGLAVIARGNLEVYQARGEYQLIIETLAPQGAGALQIAFEQLKKKLAAEGLFEPSRKRALPKLPRRIGIITSPSGAVIRDMLHVLERRFRGLHIRLFPAQVQGEGAIEQVCAGLHYFSRTDWAEVLILARGGGSLEDLWTFNEEAVARAIAASSVPIISAIGHETDFTIADFVADHRAPTPSAAAEIVICTSASLADQVSTCRGKLVQAMRYRLLRAARDLNQRGIERAERLTLRHLREASQKTDDLDARLHAALRTRLEQHRRILKHLDDRLQRSNLQLRFAQIRHRAELLNERLRKATERKLWNARAREQKAGLHLQQLSPLAILERGYAIVEKPDGTIVRSSAQTTPGDEIHVRVHEGDLRAEVL
ncbi:MAG TPA: exodeoxyribonuclease VII large subunit [Bryobacteraceae bacterium]|nr:exodeoxyribonuclease VII large subunit [Bryobacteraceae bacterium]